MAITALSAGLSPPGSRVLKIKDRPPYNSSIPLHILAPTGETQISAQSPYTHPGSKLATAAVALRGPAGQRRRLATEVSMVRIARVAGKTQASSGRDGPWGGSAPSRDSCGWNELHVLLLDEAC